MDDLENEKSDEKTDSCRVKRMRGWLGVKSVFFGRLWRRSFWLESLTFLFSN